MKRPFLYFLYALKIHLKKPSTWLITAGVIFVLLFLAKLSLPTSDNTLVGIYPGNDPGPSVEKIVTSLGCVSEASAQTIADPSSSRQSYTFLRYDSAEALTEDVASSKLECGFLFADDFESELRSGDDRATEDLILCLTGPYSVRSQLISEEVYTAFLGEYSDVLLTDSAQALFPTISADEAQKIISRSHELRDSDQVFHMILKEYATTNGADSSPQELSANNSSIIPPTLAPMIRGVFGCLLFLIMFFGCGVRFREDHRKLEVVLLPREKVMLRLTDALVPGLLPAASGYLFLTVTGASRGPLREALLLLLLLMLNSLWISLFAATQKRRTDLAAASVIFLLLHILLCPVFLDLSQFVPAIRFVRMLLPLSWYLGPISLFG